MLWGEMDIHEGKMTRTGTCLAVYSLEGQPVIVLILKELVKTKNSIQMMLAMVLLYGKMKMDILSLCNRE